MTRATRSQVNLQSPRTDDPPSKKTKESRKRKRVSNASEVEEERSPKHQRRSSDVQPEEEPALDSVQARLILEILEEIDTQGLLDRVFPTPADGLIRSSESKLLSLRALLQKHGDIGIQTLRAAINPLFPISAYPRARLSSTAQQQQDFCHLALQLIDEADQQSSTRVPLQESNIFPELEDLPTTSIADGSRIMRRHALMQKLSSGEYWTSLNSRSMDDETSTEQISPAYAHKVSILPSLPPPPSTIRHTLGSYEANKTISKSKALYLQPKSMSKGSFLDYGPNCSFAPSWDSQGGQVGRDALGAVVEDFRRKRRYQIASLKKSSVIQDVREPNPVIDPVLSNELEDPVDLLEPMREIWEIEELMQQLLSNNAIAIERLQFLQNLRLAKEDGMQRVDGLEMETADVLEESLSLLAFTRPRSIGLSNEDRSSIVPSLSALRQLHDLLPIAITGGWQGTLADGRSRALCDDTTLRSKTGHSSNKIPAANGATPNPAHPATPYKAGYSYYPGTPVNGQPLYFPATYNPTTLATQTGYPFSNTWSYGYQPPTPGQKLSTPGAPYPSFFAMPPPSGQRAVANTVKPLAQQPNGWGATALPPHMRRAANAASPTPVKTGVS